MKRSLPRLQPPFRTAAFSAIAVFLVIAGCSSTNGSSLPLTPSSSTIDQADAAPTTGLSAHGAVTAPSQPGHSRQTHQPTPGASARTSAAAPAADGATKPTKPSKSGPPRTIIVGRPTLPDPEKPSASGPDSSSSGDQASGTSSTSHPAGSSTGHAGRPPGSLSTDGDLIVAATSAAAAAGVAPADPDTPGPESGPACSADSSYVNEKPTGLRSDVITAWRAAVTAGAKQDITLCLNDGKRSRAQQQAQYDEYVREYGKQVADELVLPPNKSAHVVGIAVDVQPATGYRWLQATDGSLGFCRIYDNEPWHFEFNPAYRTTGCPQRLPEPER